jgi:hypothetical protein
MTQPKYQKLLLLHEINEEGELKNKSKVTKKSTIKSEAK